MLKCMIKKVKVILKNGEEIIGVYNDEFYEESSILVDCFVIEISDIDKIVLIEK